MKRTPLKQKIAFFAGDLLDWIRDLVWSVIGLFFDQVKTEPGWEEAIREAAARGAVAHVLRTVHLFDSLCLVYFCRKMGLPPIGHVYGLEDWFYPPFRWIYRFMTYQRRGADVRAHVLRVLDDGGSVLICLRKTPKTLRKQGTEIGEEPLGWLAERAAAAGAGPVVLMPHTFLWGRRPEKTEKGWWDMLFGPRESPGILRSVVQVVRSVRSATVLRCGCFDLAELARAEGWAPGGEGGAPAVKAVRDRLAHEIDAMRQTVAGPALRSPYRMADLVMADEEVEAEIARQVREEGKDPQKLRMRCRRMLREVIPHYHVGFIQAFDAIVRLAGLWDGVFDGVHIDDEDVELLRGLARKGPLILLPAHRSHVDYILVSDLFHNRLNLMVPYIAAGRNLSFWPLGWFFGGSGAFFIRRAIDDDLLYRAALAGFIRRVVADGNHVEIFMEGTRSRSGRMLPPKLGLFSMVVDAARRLPEGREATFLPVAINYERVIEERSYSREQTGGEKGAESIQGVIESEDVLQSRYGAIHVRVGTPVLMSELRREFPGGLDHAALRRVAYRIFHEIDRKFHLTPTGLVATVLLGPHAPEVSEEDFFRDAAFYLRFAASTGKLVSDVLRPCTAIADEEIGDETRRAWRALREALYHALHLLAGDDLVRMTGAGGGTYWVPPEARLRVSYYMNTFFGTMAPHALWCKGLAVVPGGRAPLGELRESARFLSRLLKHEFIFNPRAGFEENFLASMTLLEGMGFVAVERGDEETVRVLRPREVARIGTLIEGVLESCYVTARAISYLARKGFGERDIVRRSFSLHRRLALERVVYREESRNRSAVTNCIKSLRDMGVLRQAGKREFERGPGYEERERIEEIAARIERFIRR